MKNGSIDWKPHLKAEAKQLEEQIKHHSLSDLTLALQTQISKQFSECAQAVERYKSTQKNLIIKPQNPKRKTVWQKGSATLYDYAPHLTKTPAILFIPSLINRSYIIDLEGERSFVGYLTSQNIRTFLLDWDEPQEDELNFRTEDYITKRINVALNEIKKITDQPIILTGYCMGGLLTLASAFLNQNKVTGLALLATPWDFHDEKFARINLNTASVSLLNQILSHPKKIPGHIIQTLFYLLHPNIVIQKYQRFNKQDTSPEELETLTILEYWVNDGISMTTPTTKECLIDWVFLNKPHKNRWKVEGKIIDPSKITLPTFFTLPRRDQIVPLSCAAPLTRAIPNTTTITPETGHVKMIMGPKAKDQFWEPFVSWIHKTA